MRIHFHLINSSLELTDQYEISGAGKFKQQAYTPLFDTEFLLYGRMISEVSGIGPKISIHLENGSVSPALITRALLRYFQEIGHEVRIYIRNFGLVVNPKIDLTISNFNVRQKNIPLPLRDILRAFIEIQHHDALLESAVEFVDLWSLEQDDIHIIAECVPGGTTTAEIMLNYFLNKTHNLPASTSSHKVRETKTEIVKTIVALFKEDFGDIEDRNKAFLLAHADYFQHWLTLTLTKLFEHKFTHSTERKIIQPRIWLGGGCMMAAPLVALKNLLSSKVIVSNQLSASIHTTPWIMLDKGNDSNEILTKSIWPFRSYCNHSLSLSSSKYSQIKLLSKVKEGVGMGAVLDFAQSELKMSNNQIVEVLDKELELYL